MVTTITFMIMIFDSNAHYKIYAYDVIRALSITFHTF